MKLTNTKNPRLRKMQEQSSALFSKTAGMFENFFCCATPHGVQDDAKSYTFPELPNEDEQDELLIVSPVSDVKQSSSAVSRSEKVIATSDSYSSKTQSSRTARGGGGGVGIVFLDAMEPRVRPILRLPASAYSVRTATTASMSSTADTIPTIQGSRTFDSECSLYSGSAKSTTAARSISSVTTAKCGHSNNNSQVSSSCSFTTTGDCDKDQSIRRVQTEGLQYLPALSATDGYRCEKKVIEVSSW